MPTHGLREGASHSRRELLKTVMCGAIAMGNAAAVATETFISSGHLWDRKFVSRAIEETIVRVSTCIGDPELAWMFENCYPTHWTRPWNFRRRVEQ